MGRILSSFLDPTGIADHENYQVVSNIRDHIVATRYGEKRRTPCITTIFSPLFRRIW
jgi:hypothetical protein